MPHFPVAARLHIEADSPEEAQGFLEDALASFDDLVDPSRITEAQVAPPAEIQPAAVLKAARSLLLDLAEKLDDANQYMDGYTHEDDPDQIGEDEYLPYSNGLIDLAVQVEERLSIALGTTPLLRGRYEEGYDSNASRY